VFFFGYCKLNPKNRWDKKNFFFRGRFPFEKLPIFTYNKQPPPVSIFWWFKIERKFCIIGHSASYETTVVSHKYEKNSQSRIHCVLYNSPLLVGGVSSSNSQRRACIPEGRSRFVSLFYNFTPHICSFKVLHPSHSRRRHPLGGEQFAVWIRQFVATLFYGHFTVKEKLGISRIGLFVNRDHSWRHKSNTKCQRTQIYHNRNKTKKGGGKSETNLHGKKKSAERSNQKDKNYTRRKKNSKWTVEVVSPGCLFTRKDEPGGLFRRRTKWVTETLKKANLAA